MRRYERKFRQPVSRASPWPRVLSMIGMLVVLFMLINRASDPEVWRWLADDRGDDASPAAPLTPPEGKPAAPPEQAGEKTSPPNRGQVASQPPAQPLVATGPTDEDPEEADYMKEAFQAVTDSTLENSSVEMAAYQHLVQWSLNQPYELMNRRARRDVLYTQLLNAPDEYRGELIRLNLVVIRILKWDLKIYEDDGQTKKDAKPAKILPVYEAWGTTPDSGAHPYNVILVDLPPGMPTGTALYERVRFVGYFFKVQKYYDGLHRVNRSPVLIGRVAWQAPPTPGFQKTDWYITYGFGAAVIVIVVISLAFVLFGQKRRRLGMTLSGSRPARMSVEEWIDHAEQGHLGDEDDADSEHITMLEEPKGPGQKNDGKGLPHGLDADHPPGE